VGSLPFITMASQSNLDNILPGDFDLANIALREIVEEPSRDWCFYYQRASYFAQRDEWLKVIKLFEDAESADLHPTNATEWLPFVEGYLRIRDFVGTDNLVSKIVSMNSYQAQRALKSLFRRIQIEAANQRDIQLIEQANIQLSKVP